MNGWLSAAAALLVCGVGPALWAVVSGPVRRRVVAQNMATLLVCLALLLLTQGYARSAYLDAALELALLGPAGTLIYVRLFAEDLHADPPRGRVTDLVSVAAAVGVVAALCAVTPPGRATAKLVLVGALLAAGNQLSSKALRSPRSGEGARRD